MKKTLLFAAAVLLLAGNMQAQSLCFVDNGTVLENDAQVNIYHFDEMMGLMEWAPAIRNTTDQDITVSLIVDVTSNPDNSMLSLCVGLSCYPPSVTEVEITVPAGKDLTSFHAQFTPNSDESKVTATYMLFDQTNDAVLASVNTTFDYPAYLAGVNSITTTSQLKLIQNGNNISCRYAFDKTASRQVVISNIVGAQVASFALTNNSGEIQLNQRLGKGVYVYTLIENGRNVKSHKVIIR